MLEIAGIIFRPFVVGWLVMKKLLGRDHGRR